MVARLTRHRFRKRSRIAFESLATKEPTHALGRKTRGAVPAFQTEKFFNGLNLKGLLDRDCATGQNFAPKSSVKRWRPRRKSALVSLGERGELILAALALEPDCQLFGVQAEVTNSALKAGGTCLKQA